MSHSTGRRLHTVRPIGVVRSPFKKPEEVLRSRTGEKVGQIEIFREYQQGLRDVDGFSHLVVIFWMHESCFKSLLVRPIYHPEKRRGVFATRHPDRPNPIGMTVVRLMNRDGNLLTVKGIDMIDGTPVLDIKPYTKRDKQENARFGWLKDVRGVPERFTRTRRRGQTRKD